MTNAQHDIAILGGGLAGLAASMESKAPVFEAADRVGGVGSSDHADGFVFDRGIHVLNTKSPKVLRFLNEIDVEMAPRQRVADIYSHGVFTAYPFQINTAGLPLSLRFRCVVAYLMRGKNPEPTNYAEWMYKTIGKGFADTFLIPYSEKFWGISPSEMTFEWTSTKVPKSSPWQVLIGSVVNRYAAVGSNAVFHYPVHGGGYGTISSAMQKRGGRIFCKHRVVEVDVDGQTVTFDNGGRFDYRILVNTIPLPELIGTIPQAPDDIRDAAGRLRTNSILVVNIGIGRANISNKHWIHVPDKDFSFFRMSFPSNFDSSLAPPGTSSISAEVAYVPGQKPNVERTVDRVIADLRRMGLVRKDDPIVTTHTYDIPYGYCIYDADRKSSVRTIRSWLDSKDILTCGRYGLWSYFWSDEAINSGRNNAAKAMKRLGVGPKDEIPWADDYEEEDFTEAAVSA